ncbi:MAG TPA: SMC-Scp complex subunit ScpB [Phycisphaerae bacterium]|nr:SMC-Scp complex subunit ScpB [Phycisphaerales bacterium]HRX84068.1 SMC-Scp complex subunit ScpB [Phycisphaerae bacterium]
MKRKKRGKGKKAAKQPEAAVEGAEEAVADDAITDAAAVDETDADAAGIADEVEAEEAVQDAGPDPDVDDDVDDDIDDDARAEAGAEPVNAAEGSEGPPVEVTTESIVEAILFATDTPLSAKKIAQILGVGNAGDVKKHIATLNDQYAATGRAFRIEEIAKGYQMLTVPAYNNWLRQVLKIREETKLSPAAMETLAIVAYKQPILRADVEAIRGVACGEVINRLREMNMVKIVGRAEEIGRPLLYGTTSRFLEIFGLGSLDDLPGVEELTPPKN